MKRCCGALALLLSLSACNAFDFGLQDDPGTTKWERSNTTEEQTAADLRACRAQGTALVIGTTGHDQPTLDIVTAAARRIPIVMAPNMSLGVTVLLQLVEQTARVLDDSYDIEIFEAHHRNKKDAPSGTLLKVVEQMQQAGYARPIDVGSNRAGRHPGTHEIGFDSAADTITLRHVARSREGFARGALKAAKWINGKRGIYEFSETLFVRE